ncbi:Folylpolyglutamate synthase [Pelotomaculum sp. FP]|uniref:bifunctional folylpolyglutamate synthase/dihydrofolate synthase n=1 Tax=Pelotomaculum sp. FP TaxID=261474 RepID=UPI0010648947|nr:folylpolyglutamate synthase/dihydrofolate synthase family protein [Pelotomaculum sp. FP]TEB16473.1 Folylpolyglutamate synthase [Pelotomaculum sp. FP]
MKFHEAMEYVASLGKFGFNFGLERIEELLGRLDNPHRKLSIIHIGGTNGKGSTTAMLAAILQEAGYRVGTFTSPHLHSYTERFRINGVNIPEESIAALISELRPHLDAMVAEGFEHPTEFEVATAVAFLYFNREKIDYLVLEVGLGGAIDSTNVAMPLLSIITNVAMDHMDYLGHTIREIAGVKAGIIKPGVPVVTAAEGEGLDVIEEVSRENNCPLIRVGQDITWEHISRSPVAQRFTIRGRVRVYENLTLHLIGRHQQVNAATAVAAAEILTELGVSISPPAVRSGLAAARWPARLEIMRREPLVIIDGAHNFAGARSLRLALEETFPGRSIVLLIGMLGDKERARVVAELAPLARAVVVTRPNSPRAGNWQELAREAKRYTPGVYVIEDISDALDKALSLAGPEELLCVTGSLYMVAEARELLI